MKVAPEFLVTHGSPTRRSNTGACSRSTCYLWLGLEHSRKIMARQRLFAEWAKNSMANPFGDKSQKLFNPQTGSFHFEVSSAAASKVLEKAPSAANGATEGGQIFGFGASGIGGGSGSGGQMHALFGSKPTADASGAVIKAPSVFSLPQSTPQGKPSAPGFATGGDGTTKAEATPVSASNAFSFGAYASARPAASFSFSAPQTSTITSATDAHVASNHQQLTIASDPTIGGSVEPAVQSTPKVPTPSLFSSMAPNVSLGYAGPQSTPSPEQGQKAAASLVFSFSDAPSAAASQSLMPSSAIRSGVRSAKPSHPAPTDDVDNLMAGVSKDNAFFANTDGPDASTWSAQVGGWGLPHADQCDALDLLETDVFGNAVTVLPVADAAPADTRTVSFDLVKFSHDALHRSVRVSKRTVRLPRDTHATPADGSVEEVAPSFAITRLRFSSGGVFLFLYGSNRAIYVMTARGDHIMTVYNTYDVCEYALRLHSSPRSYTFLALSLASDVDTGCAQLVVDAYHISVELRQPTYEHLARVQVADLSSSPIDARAFTGHLVSLYDPVAVAQSQLGSMYTPAMLLYVVCFDGEAVAPGGPLYRRIFLLSPLVLFRDDARLKTSVWSALDQAVRVLIEDTFASDSYCKGTGSLDFVRIQALDPRIAPCKDLRLGDTWASSPVTFAYAENIIREAETLVVLHLGSSSGVYAFRLFVVADVLRRTPAESSAALEAVYLRRALCPGRHLRCRIRPLFSWAALDAQQATVILTRCISNVLIITGCNGVLVLASLPLLAASDQNLSVIHVPSLEKKDIETIGMAAMQVRSVPAAETTELLALIAQNTDTGRSIMLTKFQRMGSSSFPAVAETSASGQAANSWTKENAAFFSLAQQARLLSKSRPLKDADYPCIRSFLSQCSAALGGRLHRPGGSTDVALEDALRGLSRALQQYSANSIRIQELLGALAREKTSIRRAVLHGTVPVGK